MTAADNLIVRSSPPSSADYARYRDHLRVDFWYSCAYCTMTELEGSGIGFSIDHYEPQKRAPELRADYQNLMWSCSTCNRLKGEHPTVELRSRGVRFLRPDKDDFAAHLALEELRVRPVTDLGRFTETMLNLNRTSLRRIRGIRSRNLHSAEAVLIGLRKLRSVSIDRLPPQARAGYLQLKAKLNRQAADQATLVATALQDLSRSPNLDVDPDAAEHARARRALLASLGAPAIAPSAEPPGS